MTTGSPFPKQPSPQLKLDEVVAYLCECQAKGWKVYKSDTTDHRFPLEQDERFVIRLSEHVWIRVHYGNGKCGIYVHRQADEIPIGWPETIQGLDQIVAYGVRSYAQIDWPSSPSAVRLSQEQPATNFVTLAGLIGNSTIEAIFDPYFDDKALANILTLFNLGIRISQTCRILTSSKGASKLTLGFISAWLAETKTNSQLRKSTSPNPHRRFLLLSGGQSLILGLSLNSLAKDEAAHIESNVSDLSFFDAEWHSATQI